MNKPKNLSELVQFLQINPEVWTRDEAGTRKQLLFVSYQNGGLWFIDKSNSKHYVPISCGMTSSETGLEFFEDRFEVTKFKVTFSYYYA